MFQIQKFFFFEIFIFHILFRKKYKKLFKLFLYAIFEFSYFNLDLETVYVLFDFFDNLLF